MEQSRNKDTESALTTSCCIVGGGPAGIMLGFLLARAGVDVLVLEKHKDFFRDFRGDTIHPSTLELMRELDLLEEFLRQPHQKMHSIQAHFGQKVVHIADMTHLPTHCKFVAFMPQWDFLNFLSSHARLFPTFRLHMETEVTGLIIEDNRVVGVKARTPKGAIEVRAKLTIGADGRASIVRSNAGLEVIDLGAPIDVLWFRVTKHPSDPPLAFGFVSAGQFMVLIDRGDYWQSAYIIRKGSFEERKQRGLDAFRQDVGRCAPFFANRTNEIKDWDDVRLLSVKVDHLKKWYREGLLCIGDSAHAMSPVGGVGINLAVQDAVATANLLAPKLLAAGPVTVEDLAAVQRRRELPTRITQRFQVLVQNRVIRRVIGRAGADGMLQPPLVLKLFARWPALRR